MSSYQSPTACSPKAPYHSTFRKRGKACVNCKRRKIRCDGNKPACGPCMRTSTHSGGCEYINSGRTRADVLAETVAHLEHRIRELESPDQDASLIGLHYPYDEGVSQPNNDSSSLKDLDSISVSPNDTNSPHGCQVEPPLIIIQVLLHNFLHHALELGFFLDIARFREAALLSYPMGHHSRPSPALLSTVYLWGVHLSHSQSLSADEHTFLSHALHHTTTALASTHPSKMLHTIQAEVLLCQYFFHTKRYLEGRCHGNAAVSLAIGCGLHKIQTHSSFSNPEPLGLSGAESNPPRDVVGLRERINAFWTVFILNNCWTVALGTPLSMSFDSYGTQIDTPWQIDMEEFQGKPSRIGVDGDSTVGNFLNKVITNTAGDPPTIVVHAKASILFERAAQLAAQYRAGLTPAKQSAWNTAFANLDDLIDTFMGGLPPADQSSPTITVTHSIAYAAVIQLHNVLAQSDVSSRKKCLVAAESVINITGTIDRDLAYINPIMAILCVAACQVLVNEASRLQICHSGLPDGHIENKEGLVATLRRGLALMAIPLDCPLV